MITRNFTEKQLLAIRELEDSLLLVKNPVTDKRHALFCISSTFNSGLAKLITKAGMAWDLSMDMNNKYMVLTIFK